MNIGNPVYQTYAISPKYEKALRSQLSNKLFLTVYSPLLAPLNGLKSALIAKNSNLLGNSQRCVRVRNIILGREFYEKQATPFPSPINRPHPSLQADFRELLEQEKKITEETVAVKAMMQQLVIGSANREDFLHLMPSALHPPIRDFYTQYGRHFTPPTKADLTFCTQFKLKHKKAFHILHARLAKNLLIT